MSQYLIIMTYHLINNKRCATSGEGPGEGADQQPGGAAAEGGQLPGHVPQEDDGSRHPLQPPLLPGRLQEGDHQQKAEAQGRRGLQAHDRRHLLPPEDEDVKRPEEVGRRRSGEKDPSVSFLCTSSLLQMYLIYLYLMLFISHWEVCF